MPECTNKHLYAQPETQCQTWINILKPDGIKSKGKFPHDNQQISDVKLKRVQNQKIALHSNKKHPHYSNNQSSALNKKNRDADCVDARIKRSTCQCACCSDIATEKGWSKKTAKSMRGLSEAMRIAAA